MTVAELIEELKKYPRGVDVTIHVDCQYFDVRKLLVREAMDMNRHKYPLDVVIED